MSNAELLHLYGFDDKLGTRNNVLKRCKQCGTDNDMNEKACKTCGSPLPKTKMLSRKSFFDERIVLEERYHNCSYGMISRIYDVNFHLHDHILPA